MFQVFFKTTNLPTECVDCVLDWGAWEACAAGVRSRTEVVLVQAVGAGAACAELATESEGNELLNFFRLLHLFLSDKTEKFR